MNHFFSLLLKNSFVSSLPDDRIDAASAPGGIRKRARTARDHGTFWFCGSPPVRTIKGTNIWWNCPGFLKILLKIAQQWRRDTKARFRILIHFLRISIQHFKISMEFKQELNFLCLFSFWKTVVFSKFGLSVNNEKGWRVTFKMFSNTFFL